MLRCYIFDFGGSKDEHLPLIEFTYNNNYKASLEMAPYKALYERPYRSPLCWAKPDEHVVMGPKVIEETTKMICVIRDKPKAVPSC